MEQKKPRILFFVRGFLIDGPHSTRARYFVRYLAAHCDIDILCFDYKKRAIEPTENTHLLRYGFLWRLCFSPESSRYPLWLKIPVKILARILGYWLFPDSLVLEAKKIKIAVREMMDKKQYDLVIGSAYPFTLYDITETVKNHPGRPRLAFDIGDPLYRNSALRSFPGVNFFRKPYEEKRLSLADHIVVTNEGTKEFFCRTYDLPADRITAVPQGYDPSFMVVGAAGHEYDHTRPLRMIYAGVFYRKLRDPGALFSAVTALAEKTQLDIFTGSSKFRVSSPRVVFHKPLPYAEILQKYQEYDVLVFLDNAYGIQTSGKIYELIAAKRPILFIYENEHSPTKKLVDDYRGVVFAKNDPAAIMGAIEQIRERYAEFSFDFPIEEHSWESRGEQYRKVIAKTTGAGGDHDQ